MTTWDREPARDTRQAGAPDARPADRIEDVEAARMLGGLIRSRGPAGVTLSGRCGRCGYMLGSASCQTSCG